MAEKLKPEMDMFDCLDAKGHWSYQQLIAYHFMREANTKGIAKIRKIKIDFNLSHGFINTQSESLFNTHMNKIFSKVS